MDAAALDLSNVDNVDATLKRAAEDRALVMSLGRLAPSMYLPGLGERAGQSFTHMSDIATAATVAKRNLCDIELVKPVMDTLFAENGSVTLFALCEAFGAVSRLPKSDPQKKTLADLARLFAGLMSADRALTAGDVFPEVRNDYEVAGMIDTTAHIAFGANSSPAQATLRNSASLLSPARNRLQARRRVQDHCPASQRRRHVLDDVRLPAR